MVQALLALQSPGARVMGLGQDGRVLPLQVCTTCSLRMDCKGAAGRAKMVPSA